MPCSLDKEAKDRKSKRVSNINGVVMVRDILTDVGVVKGNISGVAMIRHTGTGAAGSRGAAIRDNISGSNHGHCEWCCGGD